VPAIAGTCFNNTVAAGAFFLGFSRQFLTHVHWRTTYLGNGDGAHGLQVLCLFSVHLLNGRACAEREKEARPRDAMIIARFIIFTPVFVLPRRAMNGPGRGREFLSVNR
jgi:hypothetical protein